MNRKKKLFIVLSIIILFNSHSCHTKHYNEMLSKKAIGFVLLGAVTIIGFYKLLNYAFTKGVDKNSGKIQDNFDKSTIFCDQKNITEKQEILLQNYHPTSLKILGDATICFYDSYKLGMVNHTIGWSPMEKKLILVPVGHDRVDERKSSIGISINPDNCLTINLSLQNAVAHLFLPIDTMQQIELHDNVIFMYNYNEYNKNFLKTVNKEDVKEMRLNTSLDIKLYNGSKCLFPETERYTDYLRVRFDVLKINTYNASTYHCEFEETFIQSNAFDDSKVIIGHCDKLYVDAKDKANVSIYNLSKCSEFNINMQNATSLYIEAFPSFYEAMPREKYYGAEPLFDTKFKENHMSIGYNVTTHMLRYD